MQHGIRDVEGVGRAYGTDEPLRGPRPERGKGRRGRGPAACRTCDASQPWRVGAEAQVIAGKDVAGDGKNAESLGGVRGGLGVKEGRLVSYLK